jgi:alkylation response protein AidB-like acyl-CoA dehydrogenase
MTTDNFHAVTTRLRPVFDSIADGALRREQARELPTEQVKALSDAGFGALRVPVEFGGAGLSLRQLAEVLIDLAAADSNLPQVFRGHIAFVEDQLVATPSPAREKWLRRFAAGEIVGNAWSEIGTGEIGVSGTVVTPTDDGWTLTGRKYYTTGSIFADWVDATARDHNGNNVTVLVSARQNGVTILDDWDGFGQQLTGTGTIVFDEALVESENIVPFDARFRYQSALYQLVLVAVLAGIAQATERDVAAAVRERNRIYSHGLASLVRDDPQIQAVVGEISSIAFVARHTVLGVADALDIAAATASARDSDIDREANVIAEIRSAQAQIVLSESVPRAATLLFNSLGASAVRRTQSLDRHWRNARVVASHNPVVYKARIVGDWAINDTPPPYIWEIGVAAKLSSP